MTQTIIEKNHFALKKTTYIDEMQGNLWEMEHPKSGAKLVWLERPDENMTFAIGFRTIPTDSTGVFHILEHSVLGGSEKYPVREPFVELLKSSLQTFLNAMTFPDKTVYPVSSRNKQDFRNLMGIYMDAVLHPTAVSNPNTFRQEGWRVETEGGKPIFQGVVYNEMKGAYSDVRSTLEHIMSENILPDTCYRHSSGGDPAHIPDLTYEQFVSEHAKYYHPSNALIVLDGAVDLDSCLGFLNSCLEDYDRQDMEFPIPMQQPLPFCQKEVPYEIGAGEDTSAKTIVSFGKLLCGYDSPVELNAASILSDYLTGGSEGPLKRAILDAGLGADMKTELHDGLQQAWFGWQVWNTDADKVHQIRAVVRATAEKVLAEGFDRDRLLGCCSSLSFRLMDRDNYGYPRGLMEAISILEPWLYGGDPAQNLRYRSIVDELNEKLDSGYFEDLLRRCLLDDETGFLAVLVPSTTLGEERVQKEQERVTAYWNSLSQADREKNEAELDALHTWQQTPDTPEQLATIPMLSLKDLQDDPKPLICHKDTKNGVTVLTHPLDSDLVYMDLHFDASDVTEEEMPMLNLLTSLLGLLETQQHSGSKLQAVIRQKIGDLQFTPSIYSMDPDHHRTVVSVRSICLPTFMEDTAALLGQILTTTRFTDGDVVRNILKQKKTANQQSLISRGNAFAVLRAQARSTSCGAAKEKLSGCEYIRWIGAHCELSDEEMVGLLADLERLAKRIFVRSRLTVSVSANAAAKVDSLIAVFPEGTAAPDKAAFTLLSPCREGILIPAGVGYAAKSINLNRLGQSFKGSFYVLSNLLTYEHLWNAVRVQGGAYGTGFRGDLSGDVYAMSYRDPTPGRSLEHFNACADVLRHFAEEQTDVTRYVLGAISDADPLLGAAGKIRLAEARFFRGSKQEDIQRIHAELQNTTIEDLKAHAAALDAMAAEQSFCIVGGKEQLDACADKLDTVLEILN